MTVVLHPPTGVTFAGDVPDDVRRQLTRVLMDAVTRALEDAATTGPRPTPFAMPTTEPSEPLDPARLRRSAYLVPSYDDEGELSPFEFRRAEAPEGTSPFDGALLVALPGLRYAHLSSTRYAVAGSLTQVYLLADNLFGTTSFAILAAMDDQGRPTFWAVGTQPPLVAADLGRASRQIELEGRPGVKLNVLGTRAIGIREIKVGDTTYTVLALATFDRDPATRERTLVWWNLPTAEAFLEQLEGEKTLGAATEPTNLRGLIFDQIDALVSRVEGGAESELQAAAEKLSTLDRKAFGLVDWQTKVRYLEILLKAWTWHEQERAVVEIFASLKSDSEVDAVVIMLREAGVYGKLFDDLDSEVYTLLTEVGEKFAREKGPLTLAGFITLLQGFGLIPRTINEAIAGAVYGPAGLVVPSVMIDEAHQAVMGFVRFGADLGEGIATIFTEPDKVLQGIGALVELLIKAQLASAGYVPAIREITGLLTKLAEKALAGARGAERLGCGEKILRRIKWRLVWEIASLFIGIGEIKAAVQAVGITEKLAGIVRLIGLLARLGEVADAEVVAARLARVAAILKAERAVFASVEEVAELMARLPERDVRKLGRIVGKVEVREGEALADLAARSPELHAVVEDTLAKAELLKTLSDKSGGLTDAVVEAFHTLLGEKGLELAEAQKVVRAIADGDGARFAAAVKKVSLSKIAADVRGAFLELLAASPRRMDAMTRYGYETFAAVYRRVSGRAERFDHLLGALEELDRRMGAEGKAADFRKLLDALERDDPAAWLRVENTRRALAGEATIDDWLGMVSGSPIAQAGLDRLLRRDQAGMMRRLVEDLSGDAEVVLALEEISRLGERELEGLLELRRYVERGGNFPAWDEILFTEPERRRALLDAIAGLRDPANPAAFTVGRGLDEVLEAALRQRNVQGGIGHLQTVESLLKQFPGARFNLEVTSLTGGAWREIDIVMELGGRRVSVEVKAYQVTTELDHARRQISKDLVRHLSDAGGPWSDLLWRFPDPGYAANFPRVQQLFIEELEALAARGRLSMPLPQARAALQSRFSAASPWKLLDILP